VEPKSSAVGTAAIDSKPVRSASLVMMMILAPSSADAISLIPTGTVAGPISVEVQASLFARARLTHLRGASTQTQLALTRARVGVDLRWKEYLRIVLEPDFAGPEADPADVFAELSPIREVELLLGRAKVPFGALELESRWRLPSISRGLVNDIVADDIGIGGRRIGAKASLRLKDVALRPGVDLGAYRDSIDDRDTDGALRLEIRPYFKGSELSVAGYARSNAGANASYGYAGAVAFTYDRHGFYLVVEGMLVRAALLTPMGVAPENATLSAGRLLIAYAIGWKDVAFEPYLGVEVLDPNARTHSDLGGAIRGGLNLRFLDVLRVGLEVDHQRGQDFFPELEQTRGTVFVGVSLE
jgi:hypothetical protein